MLRSSCVMSPVSLISSSAFIFMGICCVVSLFSPHVDVASHVIMRLYHVSHLCKLISGVSISHWHTSSQTGNLQRLSHWDTVPPFNGPSSHSSFSSIFPSQQYHNISLQLSPVPTTHCIWYCLQGSSAMLGGVPVKMCCSIP